MRSAVLGPLLGTAGHCWALCWAPCWRPPAPALISSNPTSVPEFGPNLKLRCTRKLPAAPSAFPARLSSTTPACQIHPSPSRYRQRSCAHASGACAGASHAQQCLFTSLVSTTCYALSKSLHANACNFAIIGSVIHGVWISLKLSDHYHWSQRHARPACPPSIPLLTLFKKVPSQNPSILPEHLCPTLLFEPRRLRCADLSSTRHFGRTVRGTVRSQPCLPRDIACQP